MALSRQVVANRENGLKGGVRTESGKAVSRLNASRHGIFSAALTPEDAQELYAVEDQLIAALRPVGRVEEILVEKLALTYLRMQRCARAEAEFHVRTWEEPHKEISSMAFRQLEDRRHYGLRAVPFKYDLFSRMVGLIDLYDARLTSQFLKILHEIERRQRLRAGEHVPPPLVADLAIHIEATKSQDGAGQEDTAQKAI